MDEILWSMSFILNPPSLKLLLKWVRLIFLCLSFHMNWYIKNVRINSFLMTDIEARYVIFGKIKDSTIVILPIIATFFIFRNFIAISDFSL